jgi:uncharacterized membrane protein
MSFESAKKYGYIGSIIRVVTPIIIIVAVFALIIAFFASLVSTIGATSSLATSVLLIGVIGAIFAVGIVDFAGYILFLIAMNRLSEYYKEKVIFKNVLNALIIQIITAVVTFTVLIAWLFFSWSSLTSTAIATSTSMPIFTRLAIYVVLFAVFLPITIYCGLLYKRAFDKLAEKSGVDGFKTAGLLYLIGSILGSLIIWIAWIFIAQNFKKLTPTQPAFQQAPYTTYQPNPEPQTATTKRCPTCGAENSPDSLYCAKCGRQL